MTIIDLTTRRPAVCFQLDKINQMTAIAARDLVSDLSIFDWYAGARIETDHYIDGWLVQLHVKIDEAMFKLIIDSGEQVGPYEFRNTYDQIAQYFRHDFKEINPHLICEKFHQLNRPMLGLLWLDLVG